MNLKLPLLIMGRMTASIGHAQSTDQIVDRTESRLDHAIDREPRAIAALDGNAPPPWSLSFSLPVTYSTNIANSEHGTRSSVHANPSVAIGREWLVGPATISVEAGADADIYETDDIFDSSTLYGSVRASFGKAEGSIAPYVDYTILGIFDGVFDNHAVTLHQLSAGAANVTRLSENASLSFDANVMRREASVREVEQTRGSLAAKYKYRADEKTTWVLGLRGQYASYTGGFSSGRDDKNLRAFAAINYDLSDQASVVLQARLDRNWSDRAGKDYAAWDMGPALNFVFGF
jgi:hypothetical protein